MKKLFILIPVLLLSLMLKAADQYPDPAVDNSIATAVSAVGNNEVIYLDEGTYTNSAAGDYTKIRGGKNITFKAIEGKKPVVQFKYSFQIREASTAKFVGIKFDDTSLSYDSYFLLYDATDNSWKFEDCEFANISKYIISVSTDKKAASVVFDKCYFHDITKSCVLIENTGESTLTVTNSTFANIDASAISAGIVDSRTATGVVTVDHCTFYNCKVKNTDYGTVRVTSPNATVSNCIFAMPTSTDNLRTVYVADGLAAGTTVTHCLMHNYTKDSNIGIPSRSGLNKVECNVGDPLFNDLANNKYTYAGTYGVSMSPARGAGTDGSDLGDPRWYTPVTYPSTDFAAPGYYCSADDATLSGTASSSKFYLYSESTPHYIAYNEPSYNDNLATWHLTATRACYITVSLDLGPKIGSNKHIFEVNILDAEGNTVGTLAEDPVDPTGATDNNTEYDQVKTFNGSIIIPAAGDYTVELRNIRGYGKGTIKNVILTYDGDAPITDFASPGYTFLAKRATLDGNIEYNTTTSTPYIRYTDNSDPGTATWSVKATRACQVKVAMNMVDNSAYSSGNGKHIFVVELLDGNEVKSSVEETGEVDENGRSFPRSYDMPGCITIPEAGDYTLRLRNTRAHSRCGLASMTLTYTYEGGETVDIPNNEIPFEDAILGNGATRDLDSNPQEIHFGSVSAYAQWNIHATAGVYTFTFDVVGTNYGTYKLDINQGNTNVFTYTQGKDGNGTVNISNVLIPAEGDYVLQLANTNSGADGYLTSLAATAASDVIIVDENETDASVITALDGTTGKKPQLIRSFKADMYNTICLPFDSYNKELEGIFGTDYVLMELNSAELSGDVLDLEFTTIAHSDNNYSAGKPYLIKPTKDVVNPQFSTHTIHIYASNNTKSCTSADFVGSYVKGVIPASENNLFLGANNMLYFPTGDTDIKGLRAYFQVKNSSGAPIRKARIVEQGNVVTELELINGEWQDIKSVDGTIKTIENGQLILIRDGKRYNVMGIRF